MKHLERDDVVIAVGLGLMVGGVAEISLAVAFVLCGLIYVALAVVVGK